MLADRGITHAQLVAAVKSTAKPLLHAAERGRVDAMSAQRFGAFLVSRFTVWGCDALLRASLAEFYTRSGKAAAGESPPSGSETFQIAQALRARGWTAYLLDLDIRRPSQVEPRRRQFAALTKVGIDRVLSRADIDGGALSQITGKEYYFGLTYGAVHNFIGSRGTTYHGQWNVFPGRARPRAVTQKALRAYLDGARRIVVLVP
ncbi:MAG: hypothetical protein R2734_06110 [Nocardioides sp.]